MTLGSPTLTFLHVLISVIGLISGLVVLYGFLTAKRFDGWNSTFLYSTIFTSVTGFIFLPFHKITPGHIVGTISLILLAIALIARSKQMAGGWRSTYVVTAMMAFYLNTFVLVVQLFEKVPPLHTLAPSQSAAPFKIAQLCVLAVFFIATIAATLKFHPERVRSV